MLEGSEVSWSKRPLALMKIRARDGIHVFNCEYQNQPGNPENAILLIIWTTVTAPCRMMSCILARLTFAWQTG